MYRLAATAAFGLEASVKREAVRMGLSDVSVSDGRVFFSGGLEAVAEANLRFRCADRILIIIGEFTAVTFDELFEKTKALPWDEWITADGKFTVTGKSVKSALFSVPDVQSIVKKAVVEKLKLKYSVGRFAETGPEYTIQAALLKNTATLTIDTTGHRDGLHKRGYRANSLGAPLKETLAAALIELSYWKNGRIFLDPACGSGTLPIEAALAAKNIAPGLYRGFASERWPQFDGSIWKDARDKARSEITGMPAAEILASDIDSAAVALAQANAKAARVADCVKFFVSPLCKLSLPGSCGVAVINPPYGERLGGMAEAERLYEEMGRLFTDETWSVYVLTSDEFFESSYGKKADAKRKLFNGGLKTDYYCYHGARPKK